MEFSYKKACPHCSQSLKFRVGDNYKKMVSCQYCNQELGFSCSKQTYFYGFSVCFWITVSLFLLKSYPVILTLSAILLFLCAVFSSVPFSKLIKLEENKVTAFTSAFQMMLLGVIVNASILTLGIFVYTQVS